MPRKGRPSKSVLADKLDAVGVLHFCTRFGITEADLRMLHRAVYDIPYVANGSHEVKIAQRLISIELLERNPTATRMVVRRTRLGDCISRSFTADDIIHVETKVKDLAQSGKFHLANSLAAAFCERALLETKVGLVIKHRIIDASLRARQYVNLMKPQRQAKHVSTRVDTKKTTSRLTKRPFSPMKDVFIQHEIAKGTLTEDKFVKAFEIEEADPEDDVDDDDLMLDVFGPIHDGD